jgi:predicted RNase H-like HicB family nuclease
MKFPLSISYKNDMTCVGLFPDIPELIVEGTHLAETEALAKEVLIQALHAQLRRKGTVVTPSQCKLGQHLIEIPDGLAARIKVRNATTTESVHTLIY